MKRTLTRARILKAALKIVEREGLDGLSMRRLADKLDVGTMSLYNHVPNKEALLDGIVELMLLEVDLSFASEKTPSARLRHFAHAMRAAAQRHPEVFRIIAVRPPSAPLLTALDGEVENLRALGFDRQEATQALRLSLGYVFGYVRLETGGFFPGLGAFGQRDGQTSDYPEIAEVADYLTEWDPDREFGVGLDALLSGLGANVTSRKRRKPVSTKGGL